MPESQKDPNQLRAYTADLDEDVLDKYGRSHGDQFAGDLVTAQRVVHSVKSSAGNIGAKILLELSSQLERLASEGNEKSIPPLMRQLEAAYSRLRPRLEIIRKGME